MVYPENLYFGTQKAYRLGIKPDNEKVRIYEAYAYTERATKKTKSINYAMVYRYTVWPAEGKFRVREVQVVFINNDSKLSSAEKERMIVKYIDSEAKRHDDAEFMSEVRDKIESAINDGALTNIIGDYLGFDLPVMGAYLICKCLTGAKYIAIEIVPDTITKYHTNRHNDLTVINEKFVKLSEKLERWLPLKSEHKNVDDKESNIDTTKILNATSKALSSGRFESQLHTANNKHMSSKLRRATGGSEKELRFNTRTAVMKNGDLFMVTYVITIYDKNKENDLGATYRYRILIDSKKKTTKIDSVHYIAIVAADGEKVGDSVLLQARDSFIQNLIANANVEYKLSQYNDLTVEEMLKKITGVNVPNFIEFLYPSMPTFTNLLAELKNGDVIDEEVRGIIRVIVHSDGAFIDQLLISKNKNNKNA